MALTKRLQQLLADRRELALLTGIDVGKLDKYSSDWHEADVTMAIRQIVIGRIVTDYTLVDEMLGEIVVKYFFSSNAIHWGPQWRTKKFRIFVHHLLDETFLLKKMAIVDAIKPMPSDVRAKIHRLNSLRNAVAHSFFPENRKEYKKTKKVLCQGKDLFKPNGFLGYREDTSGLIVYLEQRVRSTSASKTR